MSRFLYHQLYGNQKWIWIVSVVCCCQLVTICSEKLKFLNENRQKHIPNWIKYANLYGTNKSRHNKFRLFKYVHSNNGPAVVSSSIPKPCFQLESGSKIVKFSNENRRQNHTNSNTSERPRRSPFEYFPPHSPLYQLPRAFNHYHRQNPPISTILDYYNEYLPSVPEDESFNHHRYQTPPRGRPPNPTRRLPLSHQGRPPWRGTMNRGVINPRPIPLPSPGFHRQRNGPNVKASYSYPRDAANIQDILSYFQNEEQNNSPPSNRPNPSPAPPTPDLTDVSMGGDFSKELHDVQTSLLKDIREFARRPVTMTNALTSTVAPFPAVLPPIKSSRTTYPRRVPNKETDENFDEDGEEVINPRTKPVRNKIKNYQIPVPKPNRLKLREQTRGDPRRDPERYTYSSGKNRKYQDLHDEDRKELYDDDHMSMERFTDIDSGRSRHNSRQKGIHIEKPRKLTQSDSESEEDHRLDNLSVKSKGQTSKYGKGRYRSSEHEVYKSNEKNHVGHRNHRLERPPSSYSSYRSFSPHSHHQFHPTTSPPVVLKRPYGKYKSISEVLEPLEMQRKSNYWNSRENIEESDLNLSSFPTMSSKNYNRNRYVPQSSILSKSPEIVEDVVEIHTVAAAPQRAPQRPPPHGRDEAHDRKAHLHTLYMEYLEKKFEAETLAEVAATAFSVPSPPQPKPISQSHSPSSSPMRMKIHIYPNEQTEVSSPVGSEINYNYYPPTSVIHPQPPQPPQPAPQRSRLAFSYSNPNAHQQNHHLNSFTQAPGPVPSSGGSYLPPPRFSSTINSGTKLGPATAIDKNKNLVLHLHVHRRNDEMDSLAGASETYSTTVKPLTYKEIYDEMQKQQGRKSYTTVETGEGDKNLSMELRLQEQKIDTLNSMLKFRQR